MRAVPADEESGSLEEQPWGELGEGRLALLDEVEGVRGALTERPAVTAGLLAAIRINTVHQTI